MMMPMVRSIAVAMIVIVDVDGVAVATIQIVTVAVKMMIETMMVNCDGHRKQFDSLSDRKPWFMFLIHSDRFRSNEIHFTNERDRNF